MTPLALPPRRSSAARCAPAALLLMASLAGCQAPVDPGARPTFWQRRAAELRASFDCELLFGPGLGARVTATRYLQAGALAIGSAEIDSNVTALPEFAAGLRAGAWRSESLRGAEYGLSPWYTSDFAIRGGGLAQWRGDLAAERGSQFSAQVHLALVGLTLGFDPLAFARLLAGLVGQEEGGESQDPDEDHLE